MLHQNLSYYLGPLFFKVGPHAKELSDIYHEKGYQYRIGVLKYYFVKFQIALSRCQVYIPEARGVNQSHLWGIARVIFSVKLSKGDFKRYLYVPRFSDSFYIWSHLETL